MTVPDADQKNMGSYISRYRTVLTMSLSLLKKSVKFRPPGQGDAFARWVVEYNHAIASLEHCRTEFKNQVWRDRYFVTNQSPFFSQNISFAENRTTKKSNPPMWWRCKNFNDHNQRDIIEFWKSGMPNEHTGSQNPPSFALFLPAHTHCIPLQQCASSRDDEPRRWQSCCPNPCPGCNCPSHSSEGSR